MGEFVSHPKEKSGYDTAEGAAVFLSREKQYFIYTLIRHKVVNNSKKYTTMEADNRETDKILTDLHSLSTGWLKIKYPTGQYVIFSQPVVRF